MALSGWDYFWQDPEADEFTAVTAGYDFCIIKATQGTSYGHAAWMQRVVREAKDAGLIVGLYHFFDPMKSGEAQADFFAERAGDLTGMLIPWIDCETWPGGAVRGGLTRADYSSRVLAMASKLRGLYGGVGIYANVDYCKHSLDERLAFCEPWVADLGNRDAGPFGPWVDYKFRQWTFSGHLPGASGVWDLDTFDGSLEDLQAYIVGGGGEPVQLVYQDRVIQDADARLINGVTRCKLSPVVWALGLQPVDHIRSLGRVYVCPPGQYGSDFAGHYTPGPVKVWDWRKDAEVPCDAYFDRGYTRVALTKLLVGLGHAATWDADTQTVLIY